MLSLSLPRVDLVLVLFPSSGSLGIFRFSWDLVSAGGFPGVTSSCVSLGGREKTGGVSISFLET